MGPTLVSPLAEPFVLPLALSLPAALAQVRPGGGGGGSDVPEPIPDPPLIANLLFEAPLGPVCALLAAGAVGWFLLSRADRGRSALAVAGSALVLAGAVIALAAGVTTDREAAAARTRELVAAVARADVPAVEAMLGDRVTVRFFGTPAPWDRDAVLERVRRYLGGTYRVKEGETAIRALRASGEGDAQPILTQCRVTVVPELTGFPASSWWKLSWRRDAQGRWLVSEIDVQQIDGLARGSTPP